MSAHMRGMHSRGECGGVVGDRMKTNEEAGALYYRAMNADIRDSNNKPLMSIVEATDTSPGKIILAETQDGYDEDGKPLPNAPLAVIHHLHMGMDEKKDVGGGVGKFANTNTKAVAYIDNAFTSNFGLDPHPDNANGNEGRGLPWEHLERVYTHPNLTKNVRKNQVNVEGVSQPEAMKLRKEAKKAKAKKENAKKAA